MKIDLTKVKQITKKNRSSFAVTTALTFDVLTDLYAFTPQFDDQEAELERGILCAYMFHLIVEAYGCHFGRKPAVQIFLEDPSHPVFRVGRFIIEEDRDQQRVTVSLAPEVQRNAESDENELDILFDAVRDGTAFGDDRRLENTFYTEVSSSNLLYDYTKMRASSCTLELDPRIRKSFPLEPVTRGKNTGFTDYLMADEIRSQIEVKIVSTIEQLKSECPDELDRKAGFLNHIKAYLAKPHEQRKRRKIAELNKLLAGLKEKNFSYNDALQTKHVDTNVAYEQTGFARLFGKVSRTQRTFETVEGLSRRIARDHDSEVQPTNSARFVGGQSKKRRIEQHHQPRVRHVAAARC